MKHSKALTLLLCLSVVVLSSCNGMGLRFPVVFKEKPPTTQAQVCQLEPLNIDRCELKQKLRIKRNRAIEINHEKQKNRLNAEITENQLTLQQVKARKLFNDTFALNAVPFEEDMFVYKVGIEKFVSYSNEGVEEVSTYLLFEGGRLNEEIVASGRLVKSTNGQEVLLRIPEKLIKGGKGVQFVMPAPSDKVDFWVEKLKPVEVPSDTGHAVLYDHKIIRLVEEEAPEIATGHASGTEIYYVRSLAPSSVSCPCAEIMQGKVLILDSSCLNFVTRDIKFELLAQ